MNPQQPQMLSYVVGAALVGLVLFLRLRRMGKSRRLRLEMIWIMPALLAAATAAVMIQYPPRGLAWIWPIGAAVAGGVVGWYRGKMMTITIDPETHALNQQASPAALIFLVAIIAVRFSLRALLTTEAEAWHLDVAAITDAMMTFITGMYAVQRCEMFIRARRMLGAARSKTPLAS